MLYISSHTRQLANKRSDSQSTHLSQKNTIFKLYRSGFHTKSKKSVLIPTQEFTVIVMELLTQQKIVRVPAELEKALILTIKTSLSQTQVLAHTFLSLLGKLCAVADNSSRQMAFKTSANVPIIGLETTHSSLRSSGYDRQYDQYHLKWWINTSHFVQGMPIHPLDPKYSFIQMPVTTNRELIWN